MIHSLVFGLNKKLGASVLKTEGYSGWACLAADRDSVVKFMYNQA